MPEAALTKARADELVAELRRAFRVGALRVGFSPDQVLALLLLGPVSVLTGWAKTDNQRTLERSMRDLGAQLDKWASVYRSWAELGQREDKTPFTWEKWLELARVYASGIAQNTAETVNGSILASVSGALVQTGKDVGGLPLPDAWPSWLKWAVGVAAGAALLSAVSPLLRAVR